MGMELKLRDKLIAGGLILLLVGGAAWRAIDSSSEPEIIQAESIAPQQQPEEAAEPEMITVHMVGAVIVPGIYHLPAGSRVYELIEKCGGFTEDADQEVLNQARPLFDGEQLVVPKIGEAPAAGAISGETGSININQASAAELTALPGIGDVRAGQIVAHREQYGPFRDPSEIMDVSGIGDATYSNIADMITVY